MNQYKATFANGKTIELSTKRVCTVGYNITTPNGEFSGFSINAKAAQSAVRNLVASVPKHDQSAAANTMRSENAAFVAACKIEIVAAVDVLAEQAITAAEEAAKNAPVPMSFNVRAMARPFGAIGAYSGTFFQVLALTRKQAIAALYAEQKYDFLTPPVVTPNDYHIEPANMNAGYFFVITPGGEESALYTYDEAKQIIELSKAGELLGSFNMRSPSLPAKAPATEAEAFEMGRSAYKAWSAAMDAAYDAGVAKEDKPKCAKNPFNINDGKQYSNALCWGRGHSFAMYEERLIPTLDEEVRQYAIRFGALVEPAPTLSSPAAPHYTRKALERMADTLNNSHARTGAGFYVDFAGAGCFRCFRARVRADNVLEVQEVGSVESWLILDPTTDTVRDGHGSKAIILA